MSDTKFTSGTWEVEKGDDCVYGGKAGMDLICQTFNNEQATADAVLIAAAPDLLAALEEMDALVESLWKSVDWGRSFNLDVQKLNEAPLRAKRAIKAAKGEK